jgi:hypothetical protein
VKRQPETGIAHVFTIGMMRMVANGTVMPVMRQPETAIGSVHLADKLRFPYRYKLKAPNIRRSRGRTNSVF